MIHLRKKKNEEHTPKVKKKTGIIHIVYGYVIVSNADDFALAYVTHDAVARGASKDSILCSSRRNA